MATISVNKLRSLVDERISIKVSGLPTNSPVTLHLQIKETYGSFSAFGHYMTDEAGRLDLDSSCSVGGTYTGLDSMGLFWSLKQDPSQRTGLRLLRREAEIPLKYQLMALNGHVMWDELAGEQKPDSGHALCSIGLERTYLSDSVERLPIKFGRLRGALFKPRSQRSCPPVIDLFGTGGGLMEHRSALLAKEGFSVLALAYFNYEDLPKELHEIDMDYFEEAVDFMLASPYSRLGPEGGLGLIGVSAGADIVANAAILFGKKVRAVAWLNGNRCRSWFPVRYRARWLPNHFPMNVALVKPSDRSDGLDSREACCSGCTEAQELPVEKSTCRFLFLSSLDDYSMPVDTGARLAARIRRSNGQRRVDHVTYPGAGHLLEPPISPCTPLCYHGLYGLNMDYGGNSKQHHEAQVDSWCRIIQLFREELDPVLARL
ncbi:hypothetical protein BOX15_Mlig030281g1 [Macrostomum lignano]|uniref:Acyl-coenzyme A thioesterase 4-like n=2 Tax=Macrostomum lignano TaxID=282301 RepID=A0A1I8G4N7_9PLAT|nr:hypothetical protein BOX15_Mlig030281g1 [Macrostomum lignano]